MTRKEVSKELESLPTRFLYDIYFRDRSNINVKGQRSL